MTGVKVIHFQYTKKNSKQIVDNSRPVSLFEKLVFGSIYDFIDKNNLFNNNQPGFRQGNSCIHQLIAITHNIFIAFDANPLLEVCGVLRDLSKAFNRVWHDDLLYKLKSNGIDVNLLKLIK